MNIFGKKVSKNAILEKDVELLKYRLMESNDSDKVFAKTNIFLLERIEKLEKDKNDIYLCLVALVFVDFMVMVILCWLS